MNFPSSPELRGIAPGGLLNGRSVVDVRALDLRPVVIRLLTRFARVGSEHEFAHRLDR